MVDSTLSTPRRLPFAILRGLAIFFGATLVAHGLAFATDGGRLRTVGNEDFTTTGISGTGIPPYLDWLGDAIAFESDLLRALGNTALLAAVGVAIGVAIGGLFALLLKVRPLARTLGVLSTSILAIAVPGVALYPIVNSASNRQSLPDPPDRLDQTDMAGLWFFLLWAVPIGLALAPVFAAKFSGPVARRTFGLDVAGLAAASRPAAAYAGFGLPTIVLLLTLAATEVMSGHNGLFGQFYAGLENNDVLAALDVVLVVVLIGALLASVLDLIPGMTSGSDEPSPPTRRSEATWPLLALLLVVFTIVGVGYLRDPSLGQITTGSVRPAIGGPWLGTDAAGRSLVERTVVALGPTLLAGVLPAIVAWIAGGLFAALIRRVPEILGRAFDALIDGLWWPAPLILPLVHLSAGNPEQSEFHLGVIALTGLMFTPLATRLAVRTAPASRNGIRAAIRVLVFLTAIGVSARLLLGFFGLTNGPHGSANADLGAMISASANPDPFNEWPLVVPAVVSIALLSLLYWLAAAVTAPVPYRKLADADPVADVADFDESLDQLRQTGPLQPQDLRTIARPSALETEADDEDRAAPVMASADADESAEAETPVLDLASRTEDQETRDPQTASEIDLTESAGEGAGEPQDSDRPGDLVLDDRELDDQTKAELEMLQATSIDLAADASRTIRLRPSTLRRAGIVAPGTEPPEENPGERSILANRTEDYTAVGPSDDPDPALATEELPGVDEADHDKG